MSIKSDFVGLNSYLAFYNERRGERIKDDEVIQEIVKKREQNPFERAREIDKKLIKFLDKIESKGTLISKEETELFEAFLKDKPTLDYRKNDEIRCLWKKIKKEV